MKNSLKKVNKKIAKFLKFSKDKWREMKNSIPSEIGGKIFKLIKISLIATTFIIIPVLFTTLSTLMGSGIIISSIYYGVFYSIVSLYAIMVILLLFFMEYNK